MREGLSLSVFCGATTTAEHYAIGIRNSRLPLSIEISSFSLAGILKPAAPIPVKKAPVSIQIAPIS